MELNDHYLQPLRNRMMALRAKIESHPRAGELRPTYGRDLYQEETRSMGLRMIRDGREADGESLILGFTQEHYPTETEMEKKWIAKMMHYLRAITDTLIDNLVAEGYIALQSNTDLPNENALYYPVQSIVPDQVIYQDLGLHMLLPLENLRDDVNADGWLYFRS